MLTKLELADTYPANRFGLETQIYFLLDRQVRREVKYITWREIRDLFFNAIPSVCPEDVVNENGEL